MYYKYKKTMIDKINIMEENWDYLIILDACRYDYFERLFENYLSGTLSKVYSSGSSTREWCKKVFREKYDDIVYISTNPIINSIMPIYGFDATNHFHKIIDVWKWGWDEDLWTVHPKTVNKAVRNTIETYPNKRLIIHYLQPHGPYITLGNQGDLGSSGKFAYRKFQKKQKKGKIRLLIGKIILKILGMKKTWQLRALIGLPPIDPLDAALRTVGEIGLRKAYEDNLKIALSYIKQILNELEGKIVITADHGELLGEFGMYGHFDNLTNPLLLEIPWFIISRTQ